MSSNLSHLLRNSRIAQVPKSKKPLTSAAPKYAPTHQIIETRPSTLHRQEWGLKAAVPSKIKTKYIVFNDLDTLERLTTFEPNGGSQWNRIRFQELGVAPKYNPGKANPLFEANASSKTQLVPLSALLNVNTSTPKPEVRRRLAEIKDLRSTFKKWLLEHDPEALLNKSFSAKDMTDSAVEFLAEKTDLNVNLASASLRKVVGTGGLTYNLHGRLRNSPNGVVSRTVVPGRFLNVEGNDRLAAIGGFVANAGSSSVTTSQMDYRMGDFVRQLQFPFAVNHATVQDNGKVVLRANVISGMSSKARIQMNSRYYQQRPPRKVMRTASAEESTKHAEELLNILTNFDSGKSKKLR
ncbi:mitochondrial 37S ribosomal protein bS1m [Lachancea thermotolerans CBS 6340]|uniref:KLTH0D09724p n=1 Tax=Lachancea thermotolerans (strain ATCC 56472 / CBS 6340 / NRRL Y-8284) TaxID=559295 RepID=C5DEU0_LACTC|nr:KLTH0D09724p [Lachancea thermotolerans CBS 6340]CAR22695.1 KLTH0D09724p [Lachancea thermotolerans CBS 6340]